jgi:hypothetical protein
MFIALSLLGATVAVQAAEQAAPKQTVTPKAEAKPDAAPPTASNAAERVELGTTQITGNRELPRVLYVVPWKRADLGDTSGKPVKSLLDEVLAPVDRDVFRRQNRYHDALQPDTAGAKAAAGGDDQSVER